MAGSASSEVIVISALPVSVAVISSPPSTVSMPSPPSPIAPPINGVNALTTELNDAPVISSPSSFKSQTVTVVVPAPIAFTDAFSPGAGKLSTVATARSAG